MFDSLPFDARILLLKNVHAIYITSIMLNSARG